MMPAELYVPPHRRVARQPVPLMSLHPRPTRQLIDSLAGVVLRRPWMKLFRYGSLSPQAPPSPATQTVAPCTQKSRPCLRPRAPSRLPRPIPRGVRAIRSVSVSSRLLRPNLNSVSSRLPRPIVGQVSSRLPTGRKEFKDSTPSTAEGSNIEPPRSRPASRLPRPCPRVSDAPRRPARPRHPPRQNPEENYA